MAENNGNGEKNSEKKVDLIFFLGPSDNPGNVITPIQLRGPNYDEWARAIRTSLQAKRKYGFVEGKVPKPTTPEKMEDWIAVHSMLIVWLLNTIEPSLCSTLSYYDDAQSLWTHLKQRFCIVNGTRICQLKTSLGECKQGKGEEVLAYFGRLSHLWDELMTYVKKPTCECGKCKSNRVDNSDKFCTHCNREGHDATSCFQLHGFPDWWGDRPRGGRGPGRNGPIRGAGRSEGRGRGTNNAPVHANKATTAQWQQLLDTLNVPKTKDHLHGKNAISWIIDTGASHHVTRNLSCLINVKKITNMPMGLPDGKDVIATKEGSVILDGGFAT
ncbi:Gag-polypeptide of LTR copia-type [Sesbania bispinosa]|nr:Gag-polypeptide of LTR copia-type [Sesbania bispinosa]